MWRLPAGVIEVRLLEAVIILVPAEPGSGAGTPLVREPPSVQIRPLASTFSPRSRTTRQREPRWYRSKKCSSYALLAAPAPPALESISVVDRLTDQDVLDGLVVSFARYDHEEGVVEDVFFLEVEVVVFVGHYGHSRCVTSVNAD